MTAAEFETYEAYVATRKAEGLQALPRVLWSALRYDTPIPPRTLPVPPTT